LAARWPAVGKVLPTQTSMRIRAPVLTPIPGMDVRALEKQLTALRRLFLTNLGQVLSAVGGSVELTQQGKHLLAHGLLDERRLVGALSPERFLEALGPGLRVPLAAATFQSRSGSGVS
jgi:hypothetical protein